MAATLVLFINKIEIIIRKKISGFVWSLTHTMQALANVATSPSTAAFLVYTSYAAKAFTKLTDAAIHLVFRSLLLFTCSFLGTPIFISFGTVSVLDLKIYMCLFLFKLGS